MNSHRACRLAWMEAKATAQRRGVAIPIKLTAMRSSKGRFFVEGLQDKGEYIKACCAFSAKAHRIINLLRAAYRLTLPD